MRNFEIVPGPARRRYQPRSNLEAEIKFRNKNHLAENDLRTTLKLVKNLLMTSRVDKNRRKTSKAQRRKTTTKEMRHLVIDFIYLNLTFE